MMGKNQRKDEWTEYYAQFDYFSPETVRNGSHPQKLEHAKKPDKAIVLIHGLTDSPHFMRAIGDFFFDELGYNVYMPLLRGHGLKNPEGMIHVSHEDWQANVDFALDVAGKITSNISIGGLSTGGTLSFYTAATDERITGSVYLFSAALDIASGMVGDIAERLLRSPIGKILAYLEKNKPLIGKNPYKYARMDKGGAIQLSKLIKDTDRILSKHRNQDKTFSKRIFAAHSAGDKTADIDGIKALFKIVDPELFTFYPIPQSVPHASIVLEEPIYPKNSDKQQAPLQQANPYFDDMMQALAKFEQEEHFA